MRHIPEVRPDAFELKPINYTVEYGTDPSLIVNRIERMEYAAKQNARRLPHIEAHNGRCIIVGAAPSIKDCLDEVRELMKDRLTILMSVNGAHKYLIDHGIIPNMHVLFEIDMKRFEEYTGGKPHKDVYYYMCSHLAQSMFDELKDHHKVIWHYYDEDPEYQRNLMRIFPGEFMIQGGYMTFFRTLTVATIPELPQYTMGKTHGCLCWNSRDKQEIHHSPKPQFLGM
jgi:hypothetical protein